MTGGRERTEEGVRKVAVAGSGVLHPGDVRERRTDSDQVRPDGLGETRGEEEEVDPEVEGGEAIGGREVGQCSRKGERRKEDAPVNRHVHSKRKLELCPLGYEQRRVVQGHTPIEQPDEPFDGDDQDRKGGFQSGEEGERVEVVQEGEEEDEVCYAEAVGSEGGFEAEEVSKTRKRVKNER